MATAIIGNQKHKLKATIVESLPDKGVSNKIYYIPNKTKGNNKYDEYVWLKDTEHPNGYFEKVGQKDIDLEPYALKEYVNTQDKIITDKLTNSYYDKTQTDKKLDTKVDKVEGKELSSNDFTNDYKTSLERLETNIKYLGHYDSYQSAMNALNDISICRNTEIVNAYLTYDTNFPNKPRSNMVIIQIISGATCKQILFVNDNIINRIIKFNPNNINDIISISQPELCVAEGLKWDKKSHKYIFMSKMGYNIDENNFDYIPFASDNTDGLMTSDDWVKFYRLDTYNYIGELNSWNEIAKLTTESTEEDIINTLIITDLDGVDTTDDKDYLFEFLGNCTYGNKVLKESSTNANVFVNHINSCYVFYTLGNKLSVLNDEQVSTLVLRSITISDGSDYDNTLAVLKNPI